MLISLVALSLGGLELSRLPADGQLAQLLWESSPELQLSRARVAAARADFERSGLLPNPSVDLSANTLPLGPQNPSAPVTQPWAEVPNYAASISELIELGKRGPRQEQFRHALDAAIFDAREQLRQRFYELREHLGEIAAAQARIGALTALAADAHRLSELQRARADKGDAPALDADRALLDEEKLKSTLGAEQEHLVSELRACAEVAGVACGSFEAPEQAAAFLSAPEGTSPGPLEQRPDLQSLRAIEDSSRAAQVLAGRRAIPDPVLRLGYVRDQYLASGNWPNSLFVGVTIPLPVFDHGQADARAAAAAAEAAARARERAMASAREQLDRLSAQAKGIESRRAQVRDRALPLARDVVARLDAAVARGAAGVQDLLIARRTLVELQLDSNDLDLAAFHSRVAIARLSGAMPTPPKELNP